MLDVRLAWEIVVHLAVAYDGMASNKIAGGGAFTSLWSTNPRPWFCLGSSDKTIKTKASHNKTRTNHSKTQNIIFYLFSIFFLS